MEIGDWVDGDQYNGRIVRVANSFIFTSPVYNYSANFNFVWDEIQVPIRFGSDVELVKRILLQAAEDVLGDIPAQAEEAWFEMRRRYKLEDAALQHQTFLKFDDNWITISLRYIVDMRRRRVRKDELYRKILQAFQQEEGRIQLASETLELVTNDKK